MEKIMSHIHREQIKCAQKMQFVIEEDKVLNEQSPDIKKLLIEDGEVVIEEIYPGTNYVHLKGKLRYQILYLTDEQERILYKTAGEIEWEEKINVEGMEPADEVSVEKQIEDMKVTCSNGRKFSMRALVSLQVEAGEVRDEEIISALIRPGMEQKKEKMTFSNLVVKKKELLRMKEETELPRTLPSIEQVLWKSLEINRWEIKPLEDNIVIGWEATMFVLYRGKEEEPIRSFETTLKHNTNLECEGSHSGLWEKCRPRIQSYEINVRQDSDGEDRILEAEINFAPEILLYEEKETEMVTDIYGIQEELIPVYRKGIAPKQEERQSLKLRLNKGIRIPASYPGILQICHVKTGEISSEIIREEVGSILQGSLPLKILYQSEKAEEPYGSLREEVSFQHRLTEGGEENKREYTVYGVVQQCNIVLLDREEIELKLTLVVELQSMNNEEKEYLESIEVKELSQEKRKELPTMAVYRAMEEEGLWEVGKRYFVPIENIKRINQLENDAVKSGQKILLVR